MKCIVNHSCLSEFISIVSIDLDCFVLMSFNCYIFAIVILSFSIYPSAEQDSQLHIPIGNNTGSLPDLTILQFPSPLTTPLDLEEQVSSLPDLTNPGIYSSTSLNSPFKVSLVRIVFLQTLLSVQNVW